MLAFARYMASTYSKRLLELIYTPLGFGVKNGGTVPNKFWGSAVLADHYDHVHVAMEKGGYVKRAGWAVVGERGPELAHLPSRTTVYPNRESEGMLSGGGVRDVFMTQNGDVHIGSKLEANSLAERLAFRIATSGS